MLWRCPIGRQDRDVLRLVVRGNDEGPIVAAIIQRLNLQPAAEGRFAHRFGVTDIPMETQTGGTVGIVVPHVSRCRDTSRERGGEAYTASRQASVTACGSVATVPSPWPAER